MLAAPMTRSWVAATLGFVLLGLAGCQAPPPAAVAPAAVQTGGSPDLGSALPTPDEGQTYVAAVIANLRSGAGASNPIIGLLTPGDAVIATGAMSGGFWAVTTAAGQAGWVWGRSLSLK